MVAVSLDVWRYTVPTVVLHSRSRARFRPGYSRVRSTPSSAPMASSKSPQPLCSTATEQPSPFACSAPPAPAVPVVPILVYTAHGRPPPEIRMTDIPVLESCRYLLFTRRPGTSLRVSWTWKAGAAGNTRSAAQRVRSGGGYQPWVQILGGKGSDKIRAAGRGRCFLLLGPEQHVGFSPGNT